MALVFTPVYDSTATITDLMTGWDNPANIDGFNIGWEIFATAKAAAAHRGDGDNYGAISRNTGTYTSYQYVEFTIGALADESVSGSLGNEISALLNFVTGVGGYVLEAIGAPGSDAKYDIKRIDGGTYSSALAATGTASSFAAGTKIRGYRSPLDDKLYIAVDTGGGFSDVLSVTDATYTAGMPGMQSYIYSDQNEGFVTRIVTGNVTDSGSAEATVTPAQATLSINGRQPLTSAFNNVRIRDVLVNETGQPVGNAANIRLMVWYSGQCIGAPDVSLNGQTTDPNGTASWSIPTGSLAAGQAIFYAAQDSVSFSNYTCARMIPSYE